MALGVLPADTVPVQAAETVSETEDNNSRDTANVIDVNTTVAGNVSDEDREDWYRFTLPSDGYFVYNTISTVTHSVTLYDSSLDEISSDRGKVVESQRYNYAKGTVFLVKVSVIHEVSGYPSTDYELNIKFTKTKNWELEDNNSRKTAEKLSGKMKGTMLSSSDEDWYKYTAPKSGYVYFKFINEDSVVTNSGWKVTAYDKDLTELASWTFNSDDKAGTFTVNAKTVLYIKISYSGDVKDSVYSITPVFKATAYVEKENNNSFKKATKIKSGKAYIGVRNYDSDEDYYKFVAPATGTFKISFTCVDEVKYGYDVTIYDSSKKELKKLSNLTDDKSVKIKMKKGKTYYIHVNRHSSYWWDGYSWLDKYKVKVSKVK
jgi:hypothetical protein